MLEFKVTNQLLARVDKFNPATDSVDYLKAKFLFNTTDWNGKTKTALFRVGTETYKKILDSDGTCTIPSEVLAASSDSKSRIASNTNKIYVSLIGEYSTTRITTNEVKVELNLSGYGDALTPSDPTESEYQQLVTQYENARAEMQEATEECVNAQERLDGVENLFANAIKGILSGAVVFADDVSPIEHEMNVKVICQDGVDTSTVTVRRCGKNLVDISNAKSIGGSDEITIGNNSITIKAGSVIYGVKLMESEICLHKNVTYALKCDLEGEHNELQWGWRLFDKNGTSVTLSKSTELTYTPSEDISMVSFYFAMGNELTVDSTISNVQIEIGETATDYESYNGETYNPSSDGVVSGVTSLSPNMTILTDTEGVLVECEYIKDTNIVVKKLADALGITI